MNTEYFMLEERHYCIIKKLNPVGSGESLQNYKNNKSRVKLSNNKIYGSPFSSMCVFYTYKQENTFYNSKCSFAPIIQDYLKIPECIPGLCVCVSVHVKGLEGKALRSS